MTEIETGAQINARLAARRDAETERWSMIANALMAEHAHGNRGYTCVSVSPSEPARCDWVPGSIDPAHVVVVFPLQDFSEQFGVVRLDQLRAAGSGDPTASVGETSAALAEVWRI